MLSRLTTLVGKRRCVYARTASYARSTAAQRVFGAGLPVKYDANGEAYVELPEGGDAAADSDSEAEDLRLVDSDLLLVSARTDDQMSFLDVNVYEEDSQNLYVHHDTLLPDFPLTLAWTDFNVEEGGEGKGNFLAVGMFEPGIEIFNLDVLDTAEPSLVLGGRQEGPPPALSKKARNRRKKRGQPKWEAPLKPESHTDAVMGLSWNTVYRNVLASSSADTTVKLWDLETAACAHTLRHHAQKVQFVRFHPHVPTRLLTGAFGGAVCMVDIRDSTPVTSGTWDLSQQHSDVETCDWDPHSDVRYAVSFESGNVMVFDCRSQKPLFVLSAHTKAASGLLFNPKLPNMLTTCGVDGTVKVWSLVNNQPTCVCSRNCGLGKLFAMAGSRDAPHIVAVGGTNSGAGGGSDAQLGVFNTFAWPGVAEAFRIADAPAVGDVALDLEDAKMRGKEDKFRSEVLGGQTDDDEDEDEMVAGGDGDADAMDVVEAAAPLVSPMPAAAAKPAVAAKTRAKKSGRKRKSK